MYKIKKIIKKIVPDFIINLYHLKIAVLANIFYGFPSRKLIVIGVTGTKGKSTTSNMIWKILTDAGYKVGMTTTANFKIANKEWINDTKMTMQGRFKLQKLIKEMVKAGCDYAVIETSSEGILQHRNFGIKYQIGIFTNLTPEHIEHHGSFENYKKAKGKLFKRLKKQKIIIANVDDKNSDYFMSFPARKYIKYGILNKSADIKANNIVDVEDGIVFEANNHPIRLHIRGIFNVYNALAAISVATSQKINWKIIENSLSNFTNKMLGRMEEIKSPKEFSVFVDYAHTPESLEMVYKTLKPKNGKLIAVFGSCGGGRDKAKRPILSRIASNYADVIIITNEDPYSEDPMEIINQVFEGIKPDFKGEKYKILDRKEAIKKAISLANKGDVVVITGKGSEQSMMVKEGKIPWNDREIVNSVIKNK